MLLIVQIKRRMNRSKTKIEGTIVSRNLESWLLVSSLLCTHPSPLFLPDLGFPYVNGQVLCACSVFLLLLLVIASRFFWGNLPPLISIALGREVLALLQRWARERGSANQSIASPQPQQLVQGWAPENQSNYLLRQLGERQALSC